MKLSKTLILFSVLFMTLSFAGAQDRTITIRNKYINIPVSHRVDRSKMTLASKGQPDREFVIRLADAEPDYWVFVDVSSMSGKKLTMSYEGNQAGLDKIYQADEIEGADQMYKEKNRPQMHFTTRRGWINDPNGLIYYDGEYHLFYQLNPYERDWENMHWGHAVSKDLVRWKELPPALYPDHNGTAFSGSAVIDYKNTSGFGSAKNPPMVAAYTGALPDRQSQCIAYSLDHGRTWTKYADNPVIDSKEKWECVDTRDPNVFWHEPAGHWVMILNERDGHSIYTSADLKEWKYESHVTGFWECPELFELPVDGNPGNTKWVVYGASGTYMIGDFDGKVFTPQHGKYYFQTGSAYAAQTFSNIPSSDGRRIQIAWGRISHHEMPFNGMMLFPTELTLRTTKDGVRLFSNPVHEIETLYGKTYSWSDLNSGEANDKLNGLKDWDCLRIKTTFKLFAATDGGIKLNGQELVRYDMNWNTINGVFYSPDDMTSMSLTADIIIDRTSVEVFIDDGAYSYSFQRHLANDGENRFEFYGDRIRIEDLTIHELESIWK